MFWNLVLHEAFMFKENIQIISLGVQNTYHLLCELIVLEVSSDQYVHPHRGTGSRLNVMSMSLKVSLHVPSPSPSPVKFTLTDRMGSEPNLPVKWSITIGTMINFDGYSDGHGTCKHLKTKPINWHMFGLFYHYGFYFVTYVYESVLFMLQLRGSFFLPFLWKCQWQSNYSISTKIEKRGD